MNLTSALVPYLTIFYNFAFVMKKSCFTILLAASVIPAIYGESQIQYPYVLSENFAEQGKKGDYPTDGWICRGLDSEPVSQLNSIYKPDGEAYVIFEYLNGFYPLSLSNFSPSQQADQWLISPEFTVPYDLAELSFTAANYCMQGKLNDNGKNECLYKVLISEGGTAPEDFKSTVYDGSLKGLRTSEITTANVFVPLGGYAGKTIRLAFINCGQDAGCQGFSNIAVGSYYAEVTNLSTAEAEVGEEAAFAVNFGMKPPVECPGVNAVVKIGDKVVAQQYFKKRWVATGSNVTLQKMEFDSRLKIEDTSTIAYTIELTPDFEGACTTVVNGVIGVPLTTYKSNLVVEEVTATGCQACPIGAASLKYYADRYPGDEQGYGKAIGIAIHGYINHLDPMSEGVEGYLQKILNLNQTTSYPQAMFNRATTGRMPYDLHIAEMQLQATSMYRAAIAEVQVPVVENSEDVYDSTLKVRFNVRHAYDVASRPVSASLVMIENGVCGNDGNYSQTNGFYNRGPEYISNAYNAPELIPYMQQYLEGGELGVSVIPYSKMVYDHVARGVFPDFAGMPLEGSWTADTDRQFEIGLKVPDTLQDFSNTEVVLLVTDSETGAIVASDVIPQLHYTYADSGVASVGDEDPADEAVYNVAGVRVARSMDVPLTPGLYICGGKKILVR